RCEAGQRDSLVGSSTKGISQDLDTEIDEIAGADIFDDEEEEVGSGQERDDSRARGNGPDHLTAGDPQGGEHPAGAASQQGIANGDRRIRTGRDDNQERNAQESQEGGHLVLLSRAAAAPLRDQTLAAKWISRQGVLDGESGAAHASPCWYSLSPRSEKNPGGTQHE